MNNLQDLLDNNSVLEIKALEAYQANLKQAAENNIDNNWVLESKKRVEALSTELGVTQVKLSQEVGS